MTYTHTLMLRQAVALLISLFLFGLGTQLHAQQNNPDNSLLPEIDPQDIEIRSQFKARFPGLRRQPILGFDPTPRVYQIDPNRMPFMETQEQVVASLPVSELSRPDPPAYNALRYSEDIQAVARLGYGSYASPVAQAWGVYRLDNGYIGGDVNYSSSGGHLDAQPSSFRFFDANVDYATKLNNKTQLHVTAGGQSDFNHMFDIASQTATPRKSYTGLNLSADIQQFKNTIEGWSASASIRNFTTDLTLDSGVQNQDELVYAGSFKKQWAGQHINETFAAVAGARGGNYSFAPDDQTWSTLHAGAEYSRLFNYTTEVTGRAEVYYVTSLSQSEIYFAPFVNVVHTFTDKLKLSGTAQAKPFIETVEQQHQANRFLSTNNAFVHSYSIDASAKVSYKYFRGSTIEGGVSYNNTENKKFYFRQPTVNPGGGAAIDGYYGVGYQNANTIKAFGSISHQLIPEKFWLSGQFYVQNPKFSNGNRMPYQEQWGVNSSASVRLFNKLIIEGWADYVGSRERFNPNESLDGFLLVGAQGDFEITKNIGAYLKVVNLLSQEYEIWDGYTERPFQVYGGITIKL
ncbi:MAG: hypothetical protein U5J95_10205 [Balneolaceae bacterium]|nr:hypothetical protein [Balneolaceae bacterium]